ncbi:hypothetical protein BGZ60DRAFT_478621 [Tricladium varicosporioides]|nr:hypothetical protein BGZ60DRAFT_478621 [Hymenoscyphus varicosporioides]
MSNTNTIYLITGANRGIGKGLLGAYLTRPNTTVIAAVRDVTASQNSISSLPVAQGSKLITIKIDSTSATDPSSAVAELRSKHQIEKIDVLISNAGIMDTSSIVPTVDTKLDMVRKHFEVNTIGPLALIQAFAPLLKASSEPKFLVITSTIGSIGLLGEYKVPFFAYGLSKAGSNYMVAKLHFEEEWLTTMAFNPGWVQTDMGTGAAQGVGMNDAPVTLEDSVRGLVEQFDAANRSTSGTFVIEGGKNAPW